MTIEESVVSWHITPVVLNSKDEHGENTSPCNRILRCFACLGGCNNTVTEAEWLLCLQDSAFVPQKDRVADALRFVEGWQGGIQEAIRNTSESNISRSKLTDR